MTAQLMKPVDFSKEINNKDLKFQNLKHFGKIYVRNWSEEVFVIKKVKNTVPWTYVISDLKGE